MKKIIYFILFTSILTLQLCTQKRTGNDISELPDSVDFVTHIAPIIRQNCTPCHNPDGIAPFTLFSFHDVAKRAKDILFVTTNRIMPPWKADRQYVRHKNERGLSDQEIAMITKWVDQGMPTGNGFQDSLPALDVSKEDADLILALPKPNLIKGNNQETFVLNYIPFQLAADAYVSSIEFVGDNKSLIHHCTYYFYEVHDSISLAGDNGPFDVDVAVRHSEEVKARYKSLSKNLSFFAGWIPGATAVEFPKNIGFKLPKRGVMMMTLHYAASPINAKDSSYLKVFFHKSQPQRLAYNITLGTGGIGLVDPRLVLKPETTSEHTIRVPVEEDISVFSVWPHMHFLGKSFKGYALSENGEAIPLVKIPDWDFRWQEIYYFNKFQRIPAGSTIIVEAAFDNTSSNINNPFNPPRLVVSQGNMATTDEMLTMMMMYVPYRKGDENLILD